MRMAAVRSWLRATFPCSRASVRRRGVGASVLSPESSAMTKPDSRLQHSTSSARPRLHRRQRRRSPAVPGGFHRIQHRDANHCARSARGPQSPPAFPASNGDSGRSTSRSSAARSCRSDPSTRSTTSMVTSIGAASWKANTVALASSPGQQIQQRPVHSQARAAAASQSLRAPPGASPDARRPPEKSPASA